MTIEWNTDLYRRIRENFMYRYQGHKKSYITAQFWRTLREHGADMIRNDVKWSTYVTDSLGMCENFYIQFDDERQFTWFLLKWS